jgi:hypothetical protein
VLANRRTRFRINAPRVPPASVAPASNVTFESEPVDPSHSRRTARLFAVNTPDGRLRGRCRAPVGRPRATGSVPVGLEPVAVAARTEGEVWVVNHVSDSVSVVDVGSTPPRVGVPSSPRRPRGIVFAGTRALVTCAQQNCVGADATDRPAARSSCRA